MILVLDSEDERNAPKKPQLTKSPQVSLSSKNKSSSESSDSSDSDSSNQGNTSLKRAADSSDDSSSDSDDKKESSSSDSSSESDNEEESAVVLKIQITQNAKNLQSKFNVSCGVTAETPVNKAADQILQIALLKMKPSKKYPISNNKSVKLKKSKF
ncbi:hypothetical protein TNCV_3049661 [Trichonephila clavipes]|nr:hypothetical protein TNCV_3049661 [Trichonephila clavipes]